MKILVTGGAGFIGSHLCESLLEQGDEVLCLDNLFSGSSAGNFVAIEVSVRALLSVTLSHSGGGDRVISVSSEVLVCASFTGVSTESACKVGSSEAKIWSFRLPLSADTAFWLSVILVADLLLGFFLSTAPV